MKIRSILAAFAVFGLLCLDASAQYIVTRNAATAIPVGTFLDEIDFNTAENGVTIGSIAWSWAQPFQHGTLATIVTNGTFTGNANGWTLNTGWAYSSNAAAATLASTDLEQSIGCVPNVAYRVRAAVTRSAGSVTVKIGGTSGSTVSATGSIDEQGICGVTGLIEFTGSGFSGTIDTVIVEQQAWRFTAAASGSANDMVLDINGEYWLELTAAQTYNYKTHKLCAYNPANFASWCDLYNVTDAASIGANFEGDVSDGSVIAGRFDDLEILIGNPTGDLSAMLVSLLEAQQSRRNTAQGGSATTITLDTLSSSANNYYRGIVMIISGTGAGQWRAIGSYNGTTKVLTISGPNWVTNPDNTSVFLVRP